ncbi:MAG: hypothetical protein WCI54_19810 [Bacteroidia bacterium]
MLKIEVRYRPVSWIPITRKASSNVPQNWADVTQQQLIAIACLHKSTLSDIAFLKVMSRLKKLVISKLSDFELYKLMEIFAFVSDQKPYHEFIIRRIFIYRKGICLCAPEGKLKGISFGQFIFADTYFANYQQSNDETDLNKFIASLYFRKDESFDEKRIQSRYSLIGKIDKNIREAIVLNYQLMHEWLALAYPLIFHTVVELTTIPSVSDGNIVLPEIQRDPNIWIKVFQNFVGDDIIHDEVWAAKPANTIFAYMTRKYKENARSHK